MKEPTHISEIIKSMDIFKNEPEPLIFRKLRIKRKLLKAKATPTNAS
jgi:hypothetical protein